MLNKAVLLYRPSMGGLIRLKCLGYLLCDLVRSVDGGVRDDPNLQLFTTCVARLVSVLHRGVVAAVTAHWQPSSIDCVRDANGSDEGCIDVEDCSPFPTE